MGHKHSKAAKQREGSNGSISSTGSVDGENKKLKKKSQFKRRLTKAFSRKSTKPTNENMDNTYASSLQTTMKRTNSDGSLKPSQNNGGSPSPAITRNAHIKSPNLHSQSITPISAAVSPRGGTVALAPRSETLSSPHISAAQGNYHLKVEATNAPDNQVDDVPDGADFLPPEELSSPKTPTVRRATTTSSFLQYELGGRSVVPKRMSKAYAFHQQIASKEIGERGAELQKIIQLENPICDIFEENPFKKGVCRLCKHPKSVHRDPYSEILDDLEDYY